MNVNYETISHSLNQYGRYILSCIQSQYSSSLTPEQLHNIENLLNTEFIVIEKPTQEDIAFFSQQAGITNPKDYSSEYIPSAHGGRTKEDNKIHIYPYTKSFKNCKTNEEIIQLCIDNILVHEIFHYFIRPNLSNEGETIKEEFGHFITEGFVQHYAEEFAQQYRLGKPKSNYGKNVEFVKQLIASFPNHLTQTQIDRMIFTYNQDELLNSAKNGNLMYEKYLNDFQFHKDISSLITIMGNDMGMQKDDQTLKDIIRHYKQIDDDNMILNDLSKQIETVFKDNIEKKDAYLLKLRTLVSDKKLKKEMSRYENEMKSFLPIEEQVKKLKSSGKSMEEIKNILGSDSYILDYVPKVLYHGSPQSLDVINSNESTQKGSYVYATDNPIHALFFSIFRNSGIARAHINEYIDKNGNYQVKYQIDERIKGALKEIISDQEITIHVCNGEQFMKPQGETYIDREWISKNGQNIVPMDKIQINVKHFFNNLENQGLVEYSKYDKTKDWKTVIDIVSRNYPFVLGKNQKNHIQDLDSMYDSFIATNFPEQLEFSKQFRNFVKEVMSEDAQLMNPKVSLEEENDSKLKYIRKTADEFLIPTKDENGKTNWNANLNKINLFLESTKNIQEEQAKSL